MNSVEIASFVLAVLSSTIITAITFGIMKEKIRAIESNLTSAIQESKADRKDLRDEQKNFVTFNHFEAVLEPIRQTLNELKTDAKEILRRMGKHHLGDK